MCIPEFKGPGLYNANNAVISSNLDGFKLFIRALIPVDSSWKIAIVFPEESNSNTLGSSKGILSKFNGLSIFLDALIDLTARSITVNVLKPRKSNLTSPIFSTSSLSY